ncbi:hypothetical protein D9M73_121310 [compost metagenome]
MRRHQRVHHRQPGQCRQHQPQLCRILVCTRRERCRRRRDDRQQQHQPGFEEQRQANKEARRHARPGRAAYAGPSQRGAGEAGRGIRQLQHRAKRQPERDHQPGAAQNIARAFLNGLCSIGNRQAGDDPDDERARQQRDKRMQAPANDQDDRQADAEHGRHDQAVILGPHRVWAATGAVAGTVWPCGSDCEWTIGPPSPPQSLAICGLRGCICTTTMRNIPRLFT